MVITTPRSLYPWKDRGDHFARNWMGVGTDLKGSGIFQVTGIRSPEGQANSGTLQRYKLFRPPLFIVPRLYLKIIFVVPGEGGGEVPKGNLLILFIILMI